MSEQRRPWDGVPSRLVIPIMAMQLGERIVYESLLSIPRLAPEIRYAVNKVLGRSTLQQNKKFQQDKARLAVYMIAEHKARLKRKGWPRGSGSIHEVALEDTADRMGMKSPALAKLCRKHGPKGEQRRKLREAAERIIAKEAAERIAKKLPPI